MSIIRLLQQLIGKIARLNNEASEGRVKHPNPDVATLRADGTAIEWDERADR